MPERDWSLIVEIIGWVGSSAILIAYALNSYQKIRSDSLIFLLLNLIGGSLLMSYSYIKDAIAMTFLNFVWVIVAVVALIKLFQRRSVKTQS